MQKEGLLADALVVITSDHGEEFRDHGGLYHASTVYEEQIRVPLVFFGPNMRRRQTIQPVSLVDIFPTILSLVDGTEDRHLASGVDLSKWLRTTNAPGRMLTRSIYAESRRFGNWKQTVVANRFKLIRDNKAGASMLFDLHRDPGETKNLISKRKDLANELLGMMHALLDR
jgi:arylsulfatase A-like enzyme